VRHVRVIICNSWKLFFELADDRTKSLDEMERLWSADNSIGNEMTVECGEPPAASYG
jgi:hypothetical protein